MPRESVGLLLFRRTGRGLEVLLAHPGGPFWRNRDEGAWTIPKGELEPNEDPLDAARREFREETGLEPPDAGAGAGADAGAVADATPRALEPVRQRGGKLVRAWAIDVGDDFDASAFKPGTFEMEWPPRSGERRSFPEIDRLEWCGLAEARRRINPAQVALLDEVAAAFGHAGDEHRDGGTETRS